MNEDFEAYIDSLGSLTDEEVFDEINDYLEGCYEEE